MGIAITLTSVALQFIASVYAFLIALASRRNSLLPFAFAVLLMGIRRTYSLYSKLALERPIDFGAELIALLISVLMLVGLVALHRSWSATQAARTETTSGKFQYKLAKSAIVLGGIVGIAGVAIGYFSYSTSRELLLRTIRDNNMTLTRAVARQSESQATLGDRDDLIERAEQTWNQTAGMFDRAYLCVIDPQGKLLFHSRTPDAVGLSVADLQLSPDRLSAPQNIGELITSDEEWKGRFTTRSGQSQVVAFARAPDFDCLFAIHLPMSDVDSAIRATVLPWAGALSFITFLLLPLSLGLLYWSYSVTLADVSRAEAEIRVAQEELLMHQRHETELAEEKLDGLREQLIKQTRLATIGQMVASIAHEIRNPLGVVRNAAYFLKRRTDKNKPKIIQYLNIIDQEVATADRVIRDMLEMARSKEPVKETFDLAHTVREVFDRLGTTAKSQCNLVCSHDPFMIFADQGQLRQVIENLVTNAVQAVDGNGEINVELHQTEEQNLISIRDDGPGIDAEHLDQLFEPLFSTRAKGTGLGLTICRQIVERHEGSIELQQHDGPGALFRVALPRQSTDATSTA